MTLNSFETSVGKLPTTKILHTTPKEIEWISDKRKALANLRQDSLKELNATIEQLNIFYKKQGYSFESIPNEPGMIQAKINGKNLFMFFTRDNGMHTEYSIYENGHMWQHIVTITDEDKFQSFLNIYNQTEAKEKVWDGSATELLKILKTTNITGEDFFNLLKNWISSLSPFEVAKFWWILSLTSIWWSNDITSMVLNQIYSQYMKLDTNQRQSLILSLPLMSLGIIPGTTQTWLNLWKKILEKPVNIRDYYLSEIERNNVSKDPVKLENFKNELKNAKMLTPTDRAIILSALDLKSRQ